MASMECPFAAGFPTEAGRHRRLFFPEGFVPKSLFIPIHAQGETIRQDWRSLLAGDSEPCPSAHAKIAGKQAPTKTDVRLLLNANWSKHYEKLPLRFGGKSGDA
jgi:hypothetical protein